MSGVNRQRLFNPMPTPSTHPIHSISHFPSENQTPLSPSSSFSLNHLHNHSFPQFQLNDPFILTSLLHSPFSSFLSPSHSPSSTHSIPILPFKTNPHRNASLSHASLIHLTPLSHSISVPIPHSQPHRCASLSYTSNLFSITHTFIPSFHLHSQFTNPA